MSRRGRRIRLAPYVYRDGTGVAGVIVVRGHREELRFPPRTPVLEVQREIRKRREQLEETVPESPLRGSLAAVVEAYLARLPEADRPERRQLLAPWTAAAGEESFFRLSRATLQGIADGWRAAGLSANRANKRISALRVAWDAVAPDHALPHAIAKVRRYGEPPPVTRGQPMALVNLVLDQVQDERDTVKGTPNIPSKSKARLRVLAWTGQPPARVMAIQPEHVRWRTKPPLLYVSPRRKGTGSSDAWIPLLPQAVDALRAFFAAKATGRFELSPLGRTLERAVKKAQTLLRASGREDEAARLEGLRVYDLRHSFLSSLATETEDIYAVAEYAGHANLQTTRRYMRSAAAKRMSAGITKLAAALPVKGVR